MTSHLTRGNLLFHQSRHQQAVEEFRQHLLQDPDDPEGHAHLALCLAELRQFDQATEHAQKSIGLAPDMGFSHFVMAHVLIKRNRFDEAKAAIDRAISLDPHVPTYFFLRGLIHGDEHQWEQVLADADAGLAIDPDDPECLNLRAQSLMKLGRREEAGASLQTALQQDPDNAFTHTTQGWTLLEQTKPDQALIHFREALRLDPDFDWARSGIVEAMKARYFVYRIFLGYIFWMMRLSPRTRWGIIIGGYFGYRVIGNLARANPSLSVFLLPLMIAYIGFALLTWLAAPLFNLLLRLNRFGRHALSSDQTHGANLFGLLLASALALAGLSFALQDVRLLIAALYTGLLMLPGSSIFFCDRGWPRWTMTGVTLALAAVGVAHLMSLNAVDGRLISSPASAGLGNLFVFGILGSQFLANAVIGAKVKH
jgi:tetratricopeptide (TPR) repeat protein